MKNVVYLQSQEKWYMTVYAIIASKAFAGHRALQKFAKKSGAIKIVHYFHTYVK